MAARDYKELACWQLANEAQLLILNATRQRAFDGFPWLRGQLQRSASSSCANMAEGFGRFSPKDFARFLLIGRASLTETLAHLDTATALGIVNAETAEKCRSLIRRSRGAATKLIMYLKTANRA